MIEAGGGGTPAPHLTSLSITQGPVAGGTATVGTGTNLTGVTGVTVNGVAATAVSSTSTTVNFTTPAGSAGAQNVVATTAGGSSNAVPETGSQSRTVP